MKILLGTCLLFLAAVNLAASSDVERYLRELLDAVHGADKRSENRRVAFSHHARIHARANRRQWDEWGQGGNGAGPEWDNGPQWDNNGAVQWDNGPDQWNNPGDQWGNGNGAGGEMWPGEPWSETPAGPQPGPGPNTGGTGACSAVRTKDDGQVHEQSSTSVPIEPDCGKSKYSTKRDQSDSDDNDDDDDVVSLLRRILNKKKQSKRIVNGQTSREGRWPWMAALTRRGEFFCGGSLISDRWILTAAHCIDDWERPCEITAQLSENTLEGQSADIQKITADRVIVHKDLVKDRKTSHIENDLALIRLSKRANVKTSEDTNVICLPSVTEQYDKTSCMVAGWGITAEGAQSNSKHLLHVNLPQIDTETCRSELGLNEGTGQQQLRPDQICFQAQHGKDVCEGDSGGPTICKNNKNQWVQVGINSYVTNGCGNNSPFVATDVKHHLGYIQDAIRRNGGA